MSRTLERSVSTPRVLASAIGAMTALSGTSWAHADDDEALTLDAVNVVDSQEETEYKVDQMQSSKYTKPLLDTPRSVTVVNEKVIKDTGSLTLQDALRPVPGVTMGAGEGGNPTGDRPFIRGFDSQGDMYVDGVRDVGAQSREIFNVQGVEVVRGTNSTMGGRGSAGGTINTVSKLPQMRNFLDLGVTWGTDQTQRYTLDGNFHSGIVAGRLNLMTHKSNIAGRDVANHDRWGLAPSITFGVGTDNRYTASYYHLQSDETPDSGIPYQRSSNRSQSNPDKPVSGLSGNWYGLKGRDYSKSRVDVATFIYEHDFTDTLHLKNTTRYGQSHMDYVWTPPDDSKGNVPNGYVWRRYNSRVSTTTTAVNQTEFFGEYYMGRFKNSFSTGIELSRENSERDSYKVVGGQYGAINGACTAFANSSGIDNSGGNCTSLYNPGYNEAWDGTLAKNYNPLETVATTQALWGLDTFEFNEHWQINLGLRLDHYKISARQHTNGALASDLNESFSYLNWQVGGVWKPLPNGSVYISYATSTTPPGSNLDNGETSNSLTSANVASNIQPEKTKNYEIGTKWDLFHDRLQLTGAAFITEKENTRVNVTATTYANAGTSRTKGVELSATGKITERWNLFAGYTYLDAKLIDAGDSFNRSTGVYTGNNSGNRMPNTPQNSLTLWTTIEAVKNHLTVGGGAIYMDKVYGDAANDVYVPSYWRYDAMAQYKVDKHWDFQVNVQNLTNKVYYDKAYAAHYANQAPGRTALLSLNYHF